MLTTVIISIFFFSSRRRHTRSYGDWSSDVCSSDLEPAKARRAEARRGLIDRAIDLAKARHRRLITHRNVPEDEGDDDEPAPIDEVEPPLVERQEVTQAKEDPGNCGGQDQEQVQRAPSWPLTALHQPTREQCEDGGDRGCHAAEYEGVAQRVAVRSAQHVLEVLARDLEVVGEAKGQRAHHEAPVDKKDDAGKRQARSKARSAHRGADGGPRHGGRAAGDRHKGAPAVEPDLREIEPERKEQKDGAHWGCACVLTEARDQAVCLSGQRVERAADELRTSEVLDEVDGCGEDRGAEAGARER